MQTTATITRSFTLESGYNFKSSKYFPAGLLLTKTDVLQRLLHEKNWHSKDAVQTVSKELFNIWKEANVYQISQQTIAQKIFKFTKEFKRIMQYPYPKEKKHFKKSGRIY